MLFRSMLGTAAVIQAADLDRVYKVASGVTQLWISFIVYTGSTVTFTAASDVSWAVQFQQH